MRGACSASPWACPPPAIDGPLYRSAAKPQACRPYAPFASHGLGPTERSGSARTGLSPVRSHALPSLLARSPGGGASYGGDPVLKRPTMLQPGDIVVERVTGNRAIVIRVVSPEETICRFGDGRFEERFAFELELPPSAVV